MEGGGERGRAWWCVSGAGAGAAWASWDWSVSRDVSDAAGPCRRGGTGSCGAAARARGLGFGAQCLCLRLSWYLATRNCSQRFRANNSLNPERSSEMWALESHCPGGDHSSATY